MDEQYRVPMEVAVALSSGRSRFLKIGPHRAMDATEVKELYRLIGDMIDQQYENGATIKRLERQAQRATTALELLRKAAGQVPGEIDGVIHDLTIVGGDDGE